MDDFSNELNSLLVDTFRNILKVEENIIKKSESFSLSISEMHLIEAIGKNKEHPKTISGIAKELNITLASVTVAVNKLIRKGYLSKEKNISDGRSVYITLTKKGEKIDRLHSYFHRKMVNNISEDLTEDEKTALIKGIQKLNSLFNKKLLELENQCAL